MTTPLPSRFAIIAGKGRYPLQLAESARRAGVAWIGAVAFRGETAESLAERVDALAWIGVGQLGRMIDTLCSWDVREAVMAGQITPGRLFRDARPDLRMVRLLAGLRRRNAATIFGAIAAELAGAGVVLADSRRFLEDSLARSGALGRRTPSRDLLSDLEYGFHLAKEMSRLDVGQTVVVKRGTALAVEGFEGTDEAIRRGAALGRGGAVVVKVSKPGHDVRFDVPVVGLETLAVLREARVAALGLEAGHTIILDREEFIGRADAQRLVVYGLGGVDQP